MFFFLLYIYSEAIDLLKLKIIHHSVFDLSLWDKILHY